MLENAATNDDKKATTLIVVLFSIYLVFCGAKPGLFSALYALCFVLLLYFERTFIIEVWGKFKYLFIFLLIFSFMNICFSYLPKNSIRGWYDFYRGAFVIFPALYVSSTKLQENFLHINKYIVSVGYVILALCSILHCIDRMPDAIVYLFGHYNNIGTVFSIIALIISSFYFSKKALKYSFWHFLFLLTSVLIVFATGSRGSLLAYSVALTVMFLMDTRITFKKIALTIMAFVLVILPMQFLPQKANGFLKIFRWSSSGRFDLYSASISSMYEKSPFFGFGADTFKNLDYGQGIVWFETSHPHSIYVEILFSTGIVGAIILTLIFTIFIYRNRPASVDSLFGSFGLVFVVFLLTRGSVDHSFFDRDFSSYFFVGFSYMLFSGVEFKTQIGQV